MATSPRRISALRFIQHYATIGTQTYECRFTHGSGEVIHLTARLHTCFCNRMYANYSCETCLVLGNISGCTVAEVCPSGCYSKNDSASSGDDVSMSRNYPMHYYGQTSRGSVDSTDAFFSPAEMAGGG